MEDVGTGVLQLLPSGGALGRRQWDKRHAVIVRLLALHVPALLLLGLSTGASRVHLLPELLVPATAVLVARRVRLSATVRAGAVALGLFSCSAMLVHLTGGSAESHFHFFVMVSVVAFYEHWVVLGLTAAFALVHHVGLSLVDPRLVYGQRYADDWVVTSLLHALALAAQCAVALAHWRAHEKSLAAERRMARQLLQREAALQEAVRRAAVDALAADVAHGVNTPVQYATDNARYLGEAVLELLALVAQTRATLDGLPAEQCEAGLQELRELHRRHDDDWDGDGLRDALGDCLAGLGEVSQLVLSLQGVAADEVSTPRPTAVR